MGELAAYALATAVSTGISAVQAQSNAKRQAAQVEAQRQRDVTQLQQAQEIEERRRREDLRRAQATQRARFAGAGISAASGSANSLLTGLARQVDQAIADSRSASRLRIDGINASAAAQRSSLLSAGRDTMLNGINSLVYGGIRRAPSLFEEPTRRYTGINPLGGGNPPSVA